MTDKGLVYNYVSREEMKTLHELSEHGGDIANHMLRLHAYKVNFEGANTSGTYIREPKKTIIITILWTTMPCNGPAM